MARKKPVKAGPIKPRLTKYDTIVLPRLDEIEGMSREGVPEEQIAKALGIAYSTFCEYKRDRNFRKP